MTGVYADFYTCGTYGWNCDVYKKDEYCITTGYRGMIGKNISSLVHPLEEKAKAVVHRDKPGGENWGEYGRRKKASLDELRTELWDIVSRNA